jgi:4-hydroxy-4-methyl-2-oxoglutarate aldolase
VAAEAAGIAGLVIDGGVRDIAALTRRRFAVFSRGVSMRGTIKASAPSVGQAISFTGTPVAAGDLVVADDDGVLVIPEAHVGHTLARGQARADKEAGMMEALAQGRSTLELMHLTGWRQA